MPDMPNKEYKRLQLRRGSSAEFDEKLLLDGEPVFYTDTGQIAVKKADGKMSTTVTEERLQSEVDNILEIISNFSAGVDGWELTENGEVQLTADGEPVGKPIPLGSGGGGIPFNGGYVNEESKLIFTQDGVDVEGIDPIAIPTNSGGGGSSGSKITFSLTSPKNQAVADTASAAYISFNVTSIDTETGDDTGDLSLDIFVGGIIKRSMSIHQGANTVNVMEFLALGDNSIKLRVTDGYELQATRGCSYRRESLTLSWNLENTVINTGTLSMQLTPVGSASKTITIKVDGTVYSTDTVTTSGRRFTKNITGLSNGGHLIEAFATMTIAGAELRSDTLVCGVVQNSGIIAVCPDEADQYTPITIPFRVISASNPSEITLSVNDVAVETRSVDQSQQSWTYRPSTAGSTKFTISCGTLSWSKTITVNSITNVEEITDSLDVKVDPSQITDLATFNYNGYGFTFSNNFDTVNGGLQNDSNGNRIIRVTAGDRLTLNYPIFAGDPTARGKEFKIIYKVQDSSNKSAEVISCMNDGVGFRALANNIYLSGNQTTISMSACEDEKTELDVNIQNKAGGDRLMTMYESCSTFSPDQYAANENFSQTVAPGITFGSDDADVILYLFRAYNRDLTEDEIKANYIFDGATGQEILNRQSRNAIYASGKLSVEEAARLNPNARFLIFNAARTSHGKKDYVSGALQQIFAAGSAYHNWTADCVEAVQGTSSVEHEPFAGANFNWTLSNIVCSDGTVLENGYAMRGIENSIPVFDFTYKKNVTAQDQIINKGSAEWYNRFQPYIREARRNDPRVRDCMESEMCVLFYRNTGDTAIQVGPDIVEPGETIFYGLGNLCSNKDAYKTFEYDDIVIEVKNNTEPQVLFKSNDLTGDNFDNNFEFRYLNEDKYTEAEAKALWQEAVDFVYETDWTAATDNPLPQVTTIGGIAYTTDSAAYRKAKWKAEASQHFNMDTLYWHHNVTLFFLLRDNRAKNMFWSLGADGRWTLVFNWDNDTGLCRNNEGYVDIEPGYLDYDTIGTSYVFNGATNALFSNLRECNFNELRANYLDRESAGAWNIDTILNYFYSNQENICESLWLEDLQHNATRVMQNLGTTAYLKRGTGRLRLHLKKALLFQTALVDSYFNCTASQADSASFRGYTPEEWAGVEPSAIFTIKPYTDMFVNVHAGSKDYRVRASAGQSVTIDLSASLNDTEIFIRDAGWIQELGDMSGMYLGTFDASKLKRVRKLLIGSSVAGYVNTNFTTASYDNCKKLEELNMGGLINAAKSFDFSPNIYLKKIYTKGSGITGISFANGGKLQEARLNAVGVLEMRNLHYLSVLDISSYASLTTLVIANSPSVDVKSIIQNAVNLVYVSLKDINVHLENSSLLMRLSNLRGIDDNGSIAEKAIVTGTAELEGMSNYCRNIIETVFPSLELLVFAILASYTVRFMLDENTQYGESQIVEEGGSAVRPAVNPSNYISPDSIKEFAGWQGSFVNIEADTDIEASWLVRTRFYTVKWLDLNGSVLQSQKIGYGSAVAYEGADLASTADYLWTGFDWKSWAYAAENLIDDNTEELTVLATYDAIERPPIRDMSNYDYVCSDDYQDNAAYTLGELAAICRDHVAQDYGLDVGDLCRLLTIENRTIPDVETIVRLECFHGSRLSTGGEKNAPHEGGDYSDFANITWGMVGTLTNPRAMASSNTNVGGYDATTMKNYLNNEVFPNLRPGWRSLIKSVQYWTTKGNSSTEMVRSDVKLRLYNAAETNLWQTEPYLSELDSQRYRHSQSYAGFPYYQNNNLRIKKSLNGAGSAQWYWVGSPTFGSASAFCLVYSNGSESTYNATTSAAVSCCFST
jgi:hypothetical protein